MASIRKEILVDARPDEVWDALRDFGGVHRRVAPGFVLETKVEPGARIVTFSNGTVARELLVDSDDKSRRLVYAVVGGRVAHHNASVQVFPEGEHRCRVIWITDVLPNELRDYISAQMTEAAVTMERTLGRVTA